RPHEFDAKHPRCHAAGRRFCAFLHGLFPATACATPDMCQSAPMLANYLMNRSAYSAKAATSTKRLSMRHTNKLREVCDDPLGSCDVLTTFFPQPARLTARGSTILGSANVRRGVRPGGHIGPFWPAPAWCRRGERPAETTAWPETSLVGTH